eukprot:EG_transcript_2434
MASSPRVASADRCVTVATPSTFYLPCHLWDPSFLPEEARQKFLNELLASDDIVRALERPPDGIAPCLNWDRFLTKHSRLYPLHTAGTGDCLLNAALLAMWGIQDHSPEATPQNTFALLRLALSLTLRHMGPAIKERWLGERLQPAGGALTASTVRKLVALDREWEDVVVDAGLPRRSLLPEHIFVLAQVLCRPIVVYGPDTINGVQYPWHELHSGIYLPVLHPPARCCRSPICLAYTAGHFSAVVAAAPLGGTPPAADAMTPLTAAELQALVSQPPRPRPPRSAPAADNSPAQARSGPSTPTLVDRQLWLAACLAAAKGDPEPLRAWRRATADVARQLTFDEAAELNGAWLEEKEKDGAGKTATPAFLVGDDIEGLIIRYETWNVYETLAEDPAMDPRCLKRPASQLHLRTRAAANYVRRVARGTLVVPPLEGALRCFLQLPQQPWSPPAQWKEAWVEVDDRTLTVYDLSFGCKGARQQCLPLDTAALLGPSSLPDWSAGVIAGAEQQTPPLRLWLKASDATLAHQWRSSLIERQLLAQIPAAPPSPPPPKPPEPRAGGGFDVFVPLVESDSALMKLRFMKAEEDSVQLLADYVDCYSTAGSGVLCARQRCPPYLPPVAEFIRSYLEVLQQRLQAGTAQGGRSASFCAPGSPAGPPPAPFPLPGEGHRFPKPAASFPPATLPPAFPPQWLPPDRGMATVDLWYRSDLCFAAGADSPGGPPDRPPAAQPSPSPQLPFLPAGHPFAREGESMHRAVFRRFFFAEK